MAYTNSSACSVTGYKSFNGDWTDWETSMRNNYLGYNNNTGFKKRCCYAIKVKTPSASGFHDSSAMTITIPLIKAQGSSAPSSGTLYARVHTLADDPTGAKNSTSIGNAEATADSNHGSTSFSGLKQQVTPTDLTVKYTFKPNTEYIVTFGFSSTSGVVQIGYGNSDFTVTLAYNIIAVGTATISFKDNGNNSCTLSGTLSAGTNNPVNSAGVVLYVTTDGRTPTTSNYDWQWKTTSSSPLALTDIGSGSYTFTKSISSANFSATTNINALIYCPFTNYSSTSATLGAKTLTYHALGNNGSVVINDDNDNTFSFTCTAGTAGSNNSIKSTTLIYKVGNGAEQSVDLGLTTASASKTHATTNVITANTTVTAKIKTVWNNVIDENGTNSKTSTAVSKTITYHGPIGTPTVSVQDLYKNSFKITGTNAADGASNKATTKFYWGYDNANNCTNEISVPSTFTLSISGTGATRQVYAKAIATPAYTCVSNTSATKNTGIKQYIAPTNPGKPKISYNKSRLTIKEPWRFSWDASSQRNTSSPVKGYTVNIYCVRNGSTSTVSTTDNITGTSITLDNPALYFKPGDIVYANVRAFTKMGKDGDNNNGDKISTSYVESDRWTVKNAGIVRVKVDSTTWKEGQVWVKTSDGWKEAESILTKTTDGWKESQ